MKKNQIIESLLFVSTSPLEQKDIDKVIGKNESINLEKVVNELNDNYKDSAMYIKAIGSGFLMVTRKDFEPFISKLIPSKKLILSNAALEVLAIIAINNQYLELMLKQLEV